MTPDAARQVARYLRRDADRVANDYERNLLREAADIIEAAATPRPTLTDEERETLGILRQSIALVVGPEDTADRRFALDAIRAIDALLARLGGGA